MPDQTRWLDDDEQRAWRAYLRGTRMLEEALDRDLQDHGLALSEYEIISMLSESPLHRLRMSELAELVVQSRSRLTHTATRLERRGWVVRQPCENDRRGVELVLTPRARNGCSTSRSPTSRACGATCSTWSRRSSSRLSGRPWRGSSRPSPTPTGAPRAWPSPPATGPRTPDPTPPGARRQQVTSAPAYGVPPPVGVQWVTMAPPGATVLRWACDNGPMTSPAATSADPHLGGYPLEAPASQALFERALEVIPGGVNSPVRAFRAVGGTPRFIASAAGPGSPTPTAAATSTSSAPGAR